MFLRSYLMPTKKAPAKKVTTAAKKPAKKVTTKTTKAKKPATTKTASKPRAKKTTAMKKPVKDLVYASDQESFWVQNGEILNSLLALREALDEMEAEVYKFHAQGAHNDFAVWVEGVLCDGDCAADLKKAKTTKGAKTVVNKHLKLYSV